MRNATRSRPWYCSMIMPPYKYKNGVVGVSTLYYFVFISIRNVILHLVSLWDVTKHSCQFFIECVKRIDILIWIKSLYFKDFVGWHSKPDIETWLFLCVLDFRFKTYILRMRTTRRRGPPRTRCSSGARWRRPDTPTSTFATSQPAGGMGWRSTPSSTSTGQTSSTTTSWPKSNPCRTSTMHSTSQNRSWGSWSSSTLKVTSERILCWNFFSSNSFMQVYTCQSYNSWVTVQPKRNARAI